MKIKALLLTLTTLLLASTNVLAAGYNAEIGLDYTTQDNPDIDTWIATGTWHFRTVETDNVPLAEAAFMGRNSSLSVGHFDFDNDIDGNGAILEVLGPRNNNLYASLGYFDVAGDDVTALEVGYFVGDNWLVSIAGSDSDGDDPVILGTKFIAPLASGQFLNFEASVDDNRFVSLGGDYYVTPQTSFGLEVSGSDDIDYEVGVRVKHYFTENLALGASYRDGVTGIELTARF